MPWERNYLDELRSLAESAGYTVVGELSQVRYPDPKYQIGPGKAEELAEMVKKLKADIVIFDNELKPVQAYNLAKLLGIEVIDRFQLILQIFAQRASTKEAKLQVQLARLRYELSRAKEKVRLAKLGEQPGFLGLGRYEVDDYYEMVKKAVSRIQRKLKELRKNRVLHRARRKELGYPRVSLSGYTNAGKSTLFYVLTKKYVPISPLLFTTLTTTTRMAEFNGRKALVTDTVGFIDRLPITLIEAFHSTLEETVLSDLILLVIDVSEPMSEIYRKLGCCMDTLREIGAEKVTKIIALNKIDLVYDKEILEERIKRVKRVIEPAIPISALYEENIKELKHTIASMLPGYLKAEASMPWCDKAQSIISLIHERGNVLKIEYENDGVKIIFEGVEPLIGTVKGMIKEVGGSISIS